MLLLSSLDYTLVRLLKLKECESTTKNYSKPRQIISDSGTSFTLVVFKIFLEDKSVRLAIINSDTPRVKGQVEIINKSFVPMLAKLIESTNKWDRVFIKVEFAINNTWHKVNWSKFKCFAITFDKY